MTGHNHYSACTCGWCLNNRRRLNRPAILSVSLERVAAFDSYDCFTNPNAKCPVCSAAVFYYQAPSGGRIFFDELGPPWPKHPCTDNSSQPVALFSQHAGVKKRQPSWELAGWEPVKIRSSYQSAGWHLIPTEDIKTNRHFDVLSATPLQIHGEVCALMMPWDANGWSVISYVNLNGRVESVEIAIFRRSQFFNTSKHDAAALRARANRSSRADYL